MKIILFILSFLFVFTSCKKEYHAFGKVSNPVTGNGLAGVKVEFFKSTGGLPGGFEEVTSTLTDANGNYDLKYKKTAGFVKLELGPELYLLGSLQNGTYQTAMQLEKGESLNINWHAVPYGEFNTHIQNVNCVNASDSMQLRNKYQFDNAIDTWGFVYNTGCYNYTSSTANKVPMGYYYYETKVIRSGITTFVYDTIFVSEGGTSFLEILY